MPTETSPGLSAFEPCLLQRVRECVRGREVIEWAANEFAPFVAQFPVVRLEDGDVSRMRDGSIYVGKLPDMVRMHARCPTSHVLLTHLNENWGAFSTPVPERTVDWGDWGAHLAAAGCTPQRVREYLDDPRVKAVVTTQHTVFAHPRILTIPLGVRSAAEIRGHLDRAHGTKTQDLLINNSGWQHRRQINERVSANFGGRVRNTYGLTPSGYLDAVAGSRFVLCPSGLGWDSYRVWETLLLGSIPVVEHSPGWHTVLDDLPALSVANFDQVTPALLAQAYPQVLSRCAHFDYAKLTKGWWVARINALLAAPP